MTNKQFLRGIVAVVALWAAAAIAHADEPRGYATYDDIGLIYLEDIKSVPKNVQTAWSFFKSSNYAAAYRQFESQVIEDRFNDEAILGLVESSKKLGTTQALLTRANKLFYRGTNKDNYALNLIRALVKWSREVETKGNADVSHYLEYAQEANRDGFLPKLRRALMLFGVPKEKRKVWDELCAQFPKAEGMQYYRCKAYVNGYIGEGYIDPVTHKIFSTVDKANYPRPDIALQIIKPYLGRNEVPKWAAYVACFAYKNTRQPDKIEPYRQIIKNAAATGNPIYVRWNNNLDKLLKPRS